MKKVFLIIGIIMLIICMAGCGTVKEKDTNKNSSLGTKTGFDVYKDAKETLDNATKARDALQNSVIDYPIEEYQIEKNW